MPKLYALLIGINEYHPASNVPSLQGCVPDVLQFKHILETQYANQQPAIEMLLNAEATRANVIHQLQTHLTRAGQEDIAILYYSGHGSREPTPPALAALSPDGKNETMVCYDSRVAGNFDLADKELAVLLGAIARRNPHLVVILDCCHAGSMSRYEHNLTNSRFTNIANYERPLETYLNGYYAQQIKNQEIVKLPTFKHVLLGACHRTEKAWETLQQRGVFSTALIQQLEQNSQQTYAQLFEQTRFAMQKITQIQHPQLETHQFFNAHSLFLNGAAVPHSHYIDMQWVNRGWQIPRGAMHGFSVSNSPAMELAIYENNTTEPVGFAKTSRIQTDTSAIECHFEADTTKSYKAALLSVPEPPIAVYWEIDASLAPAMELISPKLQTPFAAIAPDAESSDYVIVINNENIKIERAKNRELVHGVQGAGVPQATYIREILEQIAQWHQLLNAQNPQSKIPTEAATLSMQFFNTTKFSELLTFDNDQFMALDYERKGANWNPRLDKIPFKLTAQNRAEKPYYWLLLVFLPNYQIAPLYQENVPIEPNLAAKELAQQDFFLPDGMLPIQLNEATTHLKLLISTKPIDAYVFVQQPIMLGSIINLANAQHRAGVKRQYPDDWRAKQISVQLIRK